MKNYRKKGLIRYLRLITDVQYSETGSVGYEEETGAPPKR